MFIIYVFIFALYRNSFPLINIAYLSSLHYAGVNRFGINVGVKQVHPTE